MAIQSISELKGQINRPGIKKLEYAPVEWIDLSTYDIIISSSWNWQQTIAFSTGDWLEMPIIPNNDGWRERNRRNDQGKYIEQEINAVTTTLRPGVSGQFEEMEEYRFIIKLTDNNGQAWLIGTKDFPMRFESSGVVGTSANGLNNYAISFFGDIPKRAYGYQPVL